MTKSIQQIKQELENIKAIAAETAVELQTRYDDYLNLLGQSVKQQLILAGYHLCTQFYPQSFLDLSLGNKQDLQQTLRQFGSAIRPDLLDILQQQELEPQLNELNLMAELIKNLPKAKIKNKISEDSPSLSEEIDLESIKAELAKIESIESIEVEELEDNTEEADSFDKFQQNLEQPLEEDEVESNLRSVNEKIEFDNPKHLLLWHKQIERKIKQNLDDTSKKVNQCLQNYSIIPDRIPAKIIDVAMQTEGRGTSNNRKLPNVPNILHLAVEIESSKKSKISASPSQISLLRLRLAEIEFSDPMLNARRGQIRSLVGKINKLNSQYKTTKQQLAIAEAQAAWRASWYEE